MATLQDDFKVFQPPPVSMLKTRMSQHIVVELCVFLIPPLLRIMIVFKHLRHSIFCSRTVEYLVIQLINRNFLEAKGYVG